MLYFQPASGVHVRIAHASTKALRRRAPRVAMFGITNACNLTCAFCSRDVTRRSEWTVDSAVGVLRGLHDAGTLEVAYGGGEPFVFRGFDEVVAELDATTALAQHVTTNGTRINRAMWPRFAGRFGQVRLSIYRDVAWAEAADTLSEAGQRWGANLLVDDAGLPGLPALLATLSARGCRDVSLLSYVGPDAHRRLDAAGDRRLAAIIADSPLPCRLSVCFGDRVDVPRLGMADGDCGAGYDFVSITANRRVQSCSFQDRSFPGSTADEILAAWRLQAAALAAPSPRSGCARVLPLTGPAPLPPIAIWQAFSGNNSGECFMVARFHALADAEAYLAELLPGWVPDAPFSEAWGQLFRDEGITTADTPAPYDRDGSPRELVAIGRTVIGVQYAVEDALLELRSLATKRGAFIVPHSVHVHDGAALVAAIRCRNKADRERVLGSPAMPDAQLRPYGDAVLAVVPLLKHEEQCDPLPEVRDAFLALAGDRPFAVEVICQWISDDALLDAIQHLGHRPPAAARLWVRFWGDAARANVAAVAALAGSERATPVGDYLLVDPAPDRKRLTVLAYRRRAEVTALDGARVAVNADVYEPPGERDAQAPRPPPIDVPSLEAAVRAAMPRDAELTVTSRNPQGRPSPELTVKTTDPAGALAALTASIDAIGAGYHLSLSDIDPLRAALRRLLDDLAHDGSA